MLGTMLGAGWLSLGPLFSLFSPHTSPQRQLAGGGVTYAVTIVAAVLLGMVRKLPVGLFRVFLASLALPFFLAAMFGSISIALALDKLAGSHVGVNGDFLLGFLLYAIVFSVIYFVLARRTRVRG